MRSRRRPASHAQRARLAWDGGAMTDFQIVVYVALCVGVFGLGVIAGLHR
jgi:hypothetical protein